MTTTTTSDITAAEWLKIRDRVALSVKSGATPNTHNQTTINVAEHLLSTGFIDLDAVLEAIRPKEAAAPPIGDGVEFDNSSYDFEHAGGES